VESSSLGAFWVGERSFNRFDLEGGVRLESVEVDPSNAGSEDFTSYAASLGMILPFGNAWSLGLLADYTARAPIAEELYSFGPHLATRAFEVGNPDLDEETALSLSANLRYAGERWFFSGTLYYNSFSDFIYETPTGEQEDGLAVFSFAQDDATFTGLDAEVRATVAEWNEGALEVSAQFDTVSGEVDVSGNDHLPRVPPSRYGLGLAGRWGIVRGSIDHMWIREQDDVADFELTTASYQDLRAFVGVDLPLGGGTTVTLFVQGRNLTDDDQRQHTSFIKDFAPMPGRTVEAGARARF
jgi:iron complex outermembrane receptor protein